MRVKIKKIHNDAIVPSYAHPSDTGFDLYTCEELELFPLQKGIAKTGLVMEFPSGWGMQIRNKSGNTVKGVPVNFVADDGSIGYIRCDITVYLGTIDCNYRGEIGIMVKNEEHDKVIRIPAGTKLAQGVLEKIYQCDFEEVVEVNETDRGEGGFGSTGDR